MKSLLSFSQNILKSNFKRLAMPYKATLSVTYWCNYKCQTCNIWLKRPKGEMTSAEYEQFFKKSNAFNWIDFTGGEVWLRPDFVDILETAIFHCKNLHFFHFTTNGYLTDKIVQGVERVLKLKPPFFSITVSVDGDEETNDLIRGKQGGFEKQLQTFMALKKMKGVDTSLGMTLSQANQGQFEKTFAAIQKIYPALSPADFHLNIAQTSSHYFDNQNATSCQIDEELIRKDVHTLVKLYGQQIKPIPYFRKKFLKGAEKFLKSKTTPMRCHALKSSCYIDPWGVVFPCVMYDAPVGKLREHDYDLEKIWHLQEAKNLQQEIWENKCPQCWTACEAYPSLMGNLLGQNNIAPRRGSSNKRTNLTDQGITLLRDT